MSLSTLYLSKETINNFIEKFLESDLKLDFCAGVIVVKSIVRINVKINKINEDNIEFEILPDKGIIKTAIFIIEKIFGDFINHQLNKKYPGLIFFEYPFITLHLNKIKIGDKFVFTDLFTIKDIVIEDRLKIEFQ